MSFFSLPNVPLLLSLLVVLYSSRDQILKRNLFADGKDIPDEFIIKILESCNQDLNSSFEELQERLARKFRDERNPHLLLAIRARAYDAFHRRIMGIGRESKEKEVGQIAGFLHFEFE